MTESDIAARVKVLTLALGDPHVSVVWNATRDLAKLGDAAKEALPALHVALKSHDPTSRLWARYAIAKITGDVSGQMGEFIKALGNKKGLFPGMASAALAGFGPEAREAVPLLIDELSEENPEYRWSAAGALANIGPEAAAAVQALTKTLNDSDEKVRWYAAWALGEIGPTAESAIPALIGLLDDIDDDVRGYAARSIANIGGPGSEEAIMAIEKLMQDSNPNLQSAASLALAKLRGS